MLALAHQEVGVRVRGRADVGVAVADASTSNTDFFDGVVVLQENNESLTFEGHILLSGSSTNDVTQFGFSTLTHLHVFYCSKI